MKQNKAQFVVDYYGVVPNFKLDEVTALLNAAGVMYAAEPWPDKYYRVYVRKDVKHVLEAIMKTLT